MLELRQYLPWITVGIGIVIVGVGIYWRFRPAPNDSADENSVSVADLISAVKHELRVAVDISPKTALPLSSVSLELSVEAVMTREGETDFKIPAVMASGKAGVETESKTSQKITVELAPPKPDVTEAAIDLTHLNLATAIVKLQSELARGMSESPKLTPKSFEIELLFSAQRKTSLGAGLDFDVLKAAGSADGTKANEQKLTLKFGQTGDEGGERPKWQSAVDPNLVHPP